MKNLLVKISFLMYLILVISCSTERENPLIIPPNFNDIPDVNNPEKIDKESPVEDVKKIKDLLLLNSQ